ncbi:DUF1007 family protein [Rhizobium sp. CFBP 8762]|uniref:DUF1007 family protein n=1 Tax=Rhizobium sp. CFBP 8762 TaxID=2775279 RepID=UPI00178135EF|nr:DUF1007 family protein [Rhizobium sp. CFBP 8762]MBD8556405.1 DUF1007 family protein [Rhizobium sp. CFBP 8762]
MKTVFLTTATLLPALLYAPLSALAHPHIFAEARLEVMAGENGAISELRDVWRFDEMFSASVLMDFDKNANTKLDPEELAEVSKTVLESLEEYNYYTSITQDGKNIPVLKPDTIHVDFQDGRLLMFFSVKPSQPMPIKGRMTFGVWDPTMYTAMDFTKDDDLVATGPQFASCKKQVVRPDPDEVLAQNQANLTDAFFNDPTGTDMSKMFATRLEVTC